ncbi:MAG: aldehyde dehydrogenase family protein [Candidatus Dormibacter sp.]|uniref:aldehyde dehydrogenase family protein n=1 Tax=Candidatus Dormibacter sp. TaxID=2973982 RepID=UPI000DB88D1A|nr:MAG: aldehyde dehydrogenase [Candidatus Dormibacteraeota bacterium]
MAIGTQTELRGIHEAMLIDGKWLPAHDGEELQVMNPAKHGELIARVPRAREADVDLAVRSSQGAFPGWRSTAPLARGKALVQIAEALGERSEDMARLIASETGNAIRTQSRPEAKTAADIFRYFGGLAGELKGDTVPLGENYVSYTVREPWGVVAGIVPWNSPVQLSALKIAMALAAGNTLVLKAAEDAPLGVLFMAELCQDHLPPGVLNVITGYGEECGAALANHPGIAKLSFTGSTDVGKSIMRAAANRILPVSLELGGKSPAIVFPDSDDDKTAAGVMLGMRFTRQGQSCTAGSRLFVHESIFDSFLDRLISQLKELKIGSPLAEETDMGAIINEKQFKKVCQYIEEGIDTKGTELLLGGPPPKEGALAEGNFVQPTLFKSSSNDWRLAREEIFGPVLVAIPWSEEAKVIEMANRSHYGLAAFVWCRDLSRALRTAHAIESGWVQVNRGGGQIIGQSYGGYKESGLGREFSLEGMLDGFTQTKSITVDLSH